MCIVAPLPIAFSMESAGSFRGSISPMCLANAEQLRMDREDDGRGTIQPRDGGTVDRSEMEAPSLHQPLVPTRGWENYCFCARSWTSPSLIFLILNL